MRKTNWMIGVAVLAAAFSLAGCADQSGMEQLNKNEFTLRGMIASDRQQIDALNSSTTQRPPPARLRGRTIASRTSRPK